jgi:hypothetical protein
MVDTLPRIPTKQSPSQLFKNPDIWNSRFQVRSLRSCISNISHVREPRLRLYTFWKSKSIVSYKDDGALLAEPGAKLENIHVKQTLPTELVRCDVMLLRNPSHELSTKVRVRAGYFRQFIPIMSVRPAITTCKFRRLSSFSLSPSQQRPKPNGRLRIVRQLTIYGQVIAAPRWRGHKTRRTDDYQW